VKYPSYNPVTYCYATVWALSISLAAILEILISLFSSRYLDVSVPWVSASFDTSRYNSRKVSPFGNPRIKAYLAAPRGLSQPDDVLHRFFESRHPPYALIKKLLFPELQTPQSVIPVSMV
jgi:hypothetical protein